MQGGLVCLLLTLIAVIRSIECSVLKIIRNESILCTQEPYQYTALSDDNLMDLFTQKGGQYLKGYMATNQEAAKEHFQNLLAISNKYTAYTKRAKFDKYEDNLKTKLRLIKDMRTFFSVFRNKTQREKRNLYNQISDSASVGVSLHKNKRTSRDITRIHTDMELEHIYDLETPPYKDPRSIGVRHVRQTSEGETTEIEYCLPRGSMTEDGYLHMCTTCAATTTLSSDKFPRILNEAICSETDGDCFTVLGTAHGTCRQKVIQLNLLRRKNGYCKLALKDDSIVIVDDWELYTQPIRVCCECLFDSRSVFASYIGGNG